MVSKEYLTVYTNFALTGRHQWRRKQFASAPAETFLMCLPTFRLCPHMRGHNDCLLPTERQLKCPLVSALQSAHPGPYLRSGTRRQLPHRSSSFKLFFQTNKCNEKLCKKKKKICQKESYKPVAVAVHLRSTHLL